jgi:hypothetical protein
MTSCRRFFSWSCVPTATGTGYAGAPVHTHTHTYLLGGQGIVNVGDVGLQLGDLLERDRQAKIALGARQVDPQLAPRLKLFVVAKVERHLLARVPRRQRRLVPVVHICRRHRRRMQRCRRGDRCRHGLGVHVATKLNDTSGARALTAKCAAAAWTAGGRRLSCPPRAAWRPSWGRPASDDRTRTRVSAMPCYQLGSTTDTYGSADIGHVSQRRAAGLGGGCGYGHRLPAEPSGRGGAGVRHWQCHRCGCGGPGGDQRLAPRQRRLPPGLGRGSALQTRLGGGGYGHRHRGRGVRGAAQAARIRRPAAAVTGRCSTCAGMHLARRRGCC